MYRMKNIVIIVIAIFSQFCLSQSNNEERVYLEFNSSSEKTYLVEVNGRKIREKFYSKGIKKNGEITFYIGKEMLSFNNTEIDTCRIGHLRNIKISNINDLKREVNKINAFYPYKVFPNLYLVEKINDSTIVKYKVKWEYYIE